LNRVQVVPLTTNVEHLYPNESLVTLRGKKNKAMADQLTTVSKMRLQTRLGKLVSTEMKGVDRALKTQLGLMD
jgi:mRNA interferase MazF